MPSTTGLYNVKKVVLTFRPGESQKLASFVPGGLGGEVDRME
jgi:hypothetical protein